MARSGKWEAIGLTLSKLRNGLDGSIDCRKFHTCCDELFGTDETKEHEWRVREIFDLFDANADGILQQEELTRCWKWIETVVDAAHILLVVDMQNDFIDGTLALRKCGYGQDAEEVIKPINNLLINGRWAKVIYTQDWHPENHISFFENLAARHLHPESEIAKETAKPFDAVVFLQPHVKQILWPKHCVVNTWGSELHKDLIIWPSSQRLYKGRHPDKESYSAFGEKNADGASELEKMLSNFYAANLYVCGIAYDICVKETCLDGLQSGFPLAVVDDCCRGVKPDDITTTKNLIIEKGGLITSTDRILSIVNEDKRSLVMAHQAAKNLK